MKCNVNFLLLLQIWQPSGWSIDQTRDDRSNCGKFVPSWTWTLLQPSLYRINSVSIVASSRGGNVHPPIDCSASRKIFNRISSRNWETQFENRIANVSPWLSDIPSSPRSPLTCEPYDCHLKNDLLFIADFRTRYSLFARVVFNGCWNFYSAIIVHYRVHVILVDFVNYRVEKW